MHLYELTRKSIWERGIFIYPVRMHFSHGFYHFVLPDPKFRLPCLDTPNLDIL